MPICSAGHPSSSVDYCDVCGAVLSLDPDAPSEPVPAGAASQDCPHCGEQMQVGTRFCEHCGAERDPATWSIDIAPDRRYFDTRGGAARGFSFPTSQSPRRIALAGDRVRIGRRSASGRTTPEIDLSQASKDPGVSREHALLLAQPNGSWTVMDTGSTNGTFVNDHSQRISPHHEVPLAEGDRVHVGVWTTLTLRRET